MIHEELKKANIASMKAQDKVSHAIYTLILGRMNLDAKENHISFIDDVKACNTINKIVKELEEETSMFEKANREERVNELKIQIKLLKNYLPKQLSEEEIINIIKKLEDKSIPSVMKHFKTNYDGQVDMKLVNLSIKKI